MERFIQLKEAFFAMAEGDYLAYALELVFAFALLYYVFKVLRDNGAIRFLVIYLVILLFSCALVLVAKGIGLQVFLTFIMLLSLFFLLIFNIEIKRSLTRVKKVVNKSNFEFQHKTTQQTEDCIAAIIHAVQNMSKKDTGALIVLANKNFQKQIVESGIRLDADISDQLLEGIFVNKAPLHDGAVIIEGHKIVAAGCFLPLTQNIDLSSEFGTRHRAALGVTEACDVTVLVVSEETGIVSIARKGQLERYADAAALRRVLREYYFSEEEASAKKKKKDKENAV